MFNLGEMNFGRYNIYRHLNNGVIKNKPFFQKSFLNCIKIYLSVIILMDIITK